MPVRFVIGRAGSGKSTRCFSEIMDALKHDPLGPPIYWILPRQATFTAERQLTCTDLGGYCRARVLSFDQLGDEIVAECGGGAIPEITTLGRHMILGHLLRQNASQLKYFQLVAHHTSLAAKVDDAIEEFHRCGKDPAHLDEILNTIAQDADDDFDNETLASKLHDIQLIYTKYTDYLGHERLDPQHRLNQILDCIDRSKALKNASVYVDSFGEFDDFQRRVLAQLGKICSKVEIALQMDPHSPVLDAGSSVLQLREMGLFHSVEEVYRRLKRTLDNQGVRVEKPIRLETIYRFKNVALAHIEKSFESPVDKPQVDANNSIELLEAPNLRAEVDAAARRINELIANGLRLRDIAVIVRNLETYHELINSAFHEHNIRYFVDQRRKMEHHPLLQFLHCTIALAQQRWPNVKLMTLAKCGLSGLTLDEADALENYVLRHRIRGLMWESSTPWMFHRQPYNPDPQTPPTSEEDKAAAMDKLRRRVVERLQPWRKLFPKQPTRVPVRQIAAEIYKTMELFEVRQTLGQWVQQARSENRHELAEEHEQAWTQVAELFEQMVDLVGDESVTLEEFEEILAASLDKFDLGLTPPTLDCVLVGQVDRTRTHAVKAVLVLGLNEGVFPAAPSTGSVITDSERTQLRRRDFDVYPDSRRRLLDERLLGYMAFTRSSELLYVSRAGADEKGRKMNPSSFWIRLQAMFSNLQPKKLAQDPRSQAELIATPRQLLTSLMNSARSDASKKPTGTFAALYHWLANHPAGNDPIDHLRHRVWPALAYRNQAVLSDEYSHRLFTDPLNASVGQIESFAACPFKHFVVHGLRLEPRRDPDEIGGGDLSFIYHRVLEKLVAQMLQFRKDWDSIGDTEAQKHIRTFAREIGESLRGELMLSSGRNRYILDRIERVLGQLIRRQRAIAARGDFQTGWSNLKFGDDDTSQLPAMELKTPAGKTMRLHGRIDRVDVLEQGTAFAIIDYRLRGQTLNLAHAYRGLSVGLLIHLLVLDELSEKLGGKKLAPAAAFYVQLLRNLESVDHPDDGDDPESELFQLACKPRGIIDSGFVQNFDTQLESGRSDVISALLKKDGTYSETGDVWEPSTFRALLQHTRKVVAQLGDQILNGRIDISPYKMGTDSACANCQMKTVCRFDTDLNQYKSMRALKRGELLDELMGTSGGKR